MANLSGTKWGSSTLGTAGGVVTWSLASSGEDITRFDVDGTDDSVAGETALTVDFEARINQAFADWSQYGNIEFIQVEDQGGAAGEQGVADIRIFFGEIPGGTIGFAFFPSNFGSDIAGDILLDTATSLNNESLLDGVLLHEIGHALGLEHTDAVSVLTPSISARTLQEYDIDAIQQVYGVQDNAAAVHNLDNTQDDLNILEGLAELTVNGNSRANVIDGSEGAETLDGAGGDDNLVGRGGEDELDGGTGNDTLDGGSGADVLNGGDGDDTLDGGSGADVLNGGDGFDTVDYSNATERVKVDVLNSGSQSGDATGDTFSGIESFIASAYDDLILGDTGESFVYGGDGNDDLRGRAGRDRLFGGDGDDRLNGGKGRDRLEGELGDDLLQGLRGLDNLRGGQGNDTLEGGDHNDLLLGGQGNDIINGGRHDDRLNGNGGSDTFVFADGDGDDTVFDFDALDNNEKIDLSGVSALDNINDITGPGGAASQTGTDVLINTGGGNSILLQDVNLNDLGSNDFLF